MWPWAFVFILLAAVGALIYSGIHWRAGTRELRERLRAARVPLPPESFLKLDSLSVPEPVRRYLHTVLPRSLPPIAAARIEHSGRFNLSESREVWRPFHSTQCVVTNRPGFDWDARISMAPGINAFVHDAYVGGVGILQVEALGLLPLADMRGTPELCEGELQRFLAESAWYPTALLPRPGLQWEPVDNRTAKATLRDGGISASLTFHFDADSGLLSSITADRYRTSHGKVVSTPWECRVWAYHQLNGMQIPTEGEVAWLLPEGRLPYWRGHIDKIEYEFEKAAA